jgi:ABC-type multidrug transport system fused ATPase/permease subunit
LDQITHGFVYVVGGLALCLRLDPALALAFAITSAAKGLLGHRLSPTRRAAAQARALAAAASAQAAEESLSALWLVKAYWNEDLEARWYAAAEKPPCSAIDAATCQQETTKNLVEFLQRCTLCGESQRREEEREEGEEGRQRHPSTKSINHLATHSSSHQTLS